MKTVFRVLTLIVAVVHVYSEQSVPPPDLDAEKKIFDSEERKEPSEINFKTSPLTKLDEEIQKELKNPTPLDDSAEVKLDVLRNLVEYEKHFKDLLVAVRNNTVSGMDLARDLQEQGGPTFLKEEFDEEKLKKVYNWDDSNVEHLKDLFKDIKSVYHNITVALKEIPTPYEIFFSKQRNTYA